MKTQDLVEHLKRSPGKRWCCVWQTGSTRYGGFLKRGSTVIIEAGEVITPGEVMAPEEALREAEQITPVAEVVPDAVLDEEEGVQPPSTRETRQR